MIKIKTKTNDNKNESENLEASFIRTKIKMSLENQLTSINHALCAKVDQDHTTTPKGLRKGKKWKENNKSPIENLFYQTRNAYQILKVQHCKSSKVWIRLAR